MSDRYLVASYGEMKLAFRAEAVVRIEEERESPAPPIEPAGMSLPDGGGRAIVLATSAGYLRVRSGQGLTRLEGEESAVVPLPPLLVDWGEREGFRGVVLWETNRALLVDVETFAARYRTL